MAGFPGSNEKKIVGVIGGSGLYQMDGLADVEEVKVETPFGDPSDNYITGRLEGVPMVFLPRHGRGHKRSPSEINYRANIYGMKQLGATHLISVSAVGSMKEELHPGEVVIVDQFFDRTFRRSGTFFEDGIVVHVSMADPVCPLLANTLYEVGLEEGIRTHFGGVYLCIEGPQFSTRGESRIYRSWGVDVIGMTNMPEARLAREAEISYATLALVTDYDCWHAEEENVTVEAVIHMLKQNVEKARSMIARAIPRIRDDRTGSPAFGALQYAIITDLSQVPSEARQRLELLLKAYL